MPGWLLPKRSVFQRLWFESSADFVEEGIGKEGTGFEGDWDPG